MEGQAPDLDEEVDGVAGEAALGPAPIRVLYDQTGEGAHLEVAAAGLDELEAAFFDERNEGRQTGGADLLARPPLGTTRGTVRTG